MTRRFAVVMLALASLRGAAAAPVKVRDLAGRLIDPLQAAPPSRATVLIFVSTECPYSNRSAPEIQRVMAEFEPKGVRFWLVYPNPSDTPALIRAHLKAFAYRDVALRDPDHALVKLAGPTVTPEAAVFTGGGVLTYRGRIDDRFVELGRERPTATKHDLSDVLTATLAGPPVALRTTQAFGCIIADLR
jgi:hypothetical protein